MQPGNEVVEGHHTSFFWYINSLERCQTVIYVAAAGYSERHFDTGIEEVSCNPAGVRCDTYYFKASFSEALTYLN